VFKASKPTIRCWPSRFSHTGRRVNFRSRHSASAALTGVWAVMATACSSGFMAWRTVSVCKSSTRLIIVRSSEVKPCADSCMTSRSSSRLPKRCGVKALPPRHRSSAPEKVSTSATSGRNTQWINRKHPHDPPPVSAQRLVQLRHKPAQDEEVRHGVADQDGPQEVLRVFEIVVQHLGRRLTCAHLLPDAQSAQRKPPRLHA